MLRDDVFAIELGEIEEYRKVFRRLAASVILGAIADLSDRDRFVRYEAAYYLKHDGAGLLEALGLKCEKIDEILAQPPQRKALRCSDGRRERYLLHGQKCREKAPSLL